MRNVHIGEKIRLLRKERKMTLDELAKGICSIGKMSNIENGITKATNEELEKISERLGVPKYEISSKEDDLVLQKIQKQISMVEDLLYLGLVDKAKECLDNLNYQLDTDHVDTFKIYSIYLKNLYLYSNNQIQEAIELSEQLVKEKTSKNEPMSEIRVKIHLCLTKWYYELKNLPKAIYHVTEAYKITTLNLPRKHYLKWKTLYNLVVIYLYAGYSAEAGIYFSQLNSERFKDGEGDIAYLSGIIDYFNGNYERAFDKIVQAKEIFRQFNHMEMFIRSLGSLSVISQFCQQQDYVEQMNELFKTNFKNLIDYSRNILDLTLRVVHYLIEWNISRDDYVNASTLLKYALLLEEKDKSLSNHYKSYILKAKIQTLNTEDSSKVKESLLKALSLMKDEISSEKGEILYTLATLEKADKNNRYYESSYQFFHSQSHEQFIRPYELQMILPPPII